MHVAVQFSRHILLKILFFPWFPCHSLIVYRCACLFLNTSKKPLGIYSLQRPVTVSLYVQTRSGVGRKGRILPCGPRVGMDNLRNPDAALRNATWFLYFPSKFLATLESFVELSIMLCENYAISSWQHQERIWGTSGKTVSFLARWHFPDLIFFNLSYSFQRLLSLLAKMWILMSAVPI